MNTLVHESLFMSACLSLSPSPSPLCQPVLWSLNKMERPVYLSWHACNLTNEYAGCMNDGQAFVSRERTEHSLSSGSAQLSKKRCGWVSVCQLWSASIMSLPSLQSDLSFFVRCITFGWSAHHAAEGSCRVCISEALSLMRVMIY